MTKRMLLVAIAALLPQTLLCPGAQADEVRRTAFPATLIGTWAEKAEQCTSHDNANVVIDASKYGDGLGSCAVRWIVETPAAAGVNYAVHAFCTSAKNAKDTDTVNIIVRPQGADAAVMGRNFDDLKTYHRCP